MRETHHPEQNHILAALPPAERERLFPHLQLVPMPLGKVLYESGELLRHVYFPTDSIVSLLYVMEDGASAEISVIGNEGVIGVALFMGGETTPSRSIVQSAGSAYRLTGRRLKEEFNRHGEMLHLLLRYTQALLTQMAQTAVCNRHHRVEQQLCRWLLLSLDRLSSNQLTMTQELIANMLGVRREGVTEAAGKLQKLGVIEYSRGQITVLDRPKLEELCCECYAVVKKETDRLLAPPRGPLKPRRATRTPPDVDRATTGKIRRPRPSPAGAFILRPSTHVFVLQPDGDAVSSSSLPARNLWPTYTPNTIEPNRHAITTGARGIANRSSVPRSCTTKAMSTTRNAAITHTKLSAAARKRDCTDMDLSPCCQTGSGEQTPSLSPDVGAMGAFVRTWRCKPPGNIGVS